MGWCDQQWAPDTLGLTAANTEKESFNKRFKNSGFVLWVLERAQLKEQHRREHEY